MSLPVDRVQSGRFGACLMWSRNWLLNASPMRAATDRR